MKTLQQQEQPANAAMPPGPDGTAASPRPPAPEDFTPPELDVAEFLSRLSGSNTSTGGRGASAAASGSSSPRSVNAPPDPAPSPARELGLPRGPGAGGDGDEDEDEDEDEQEVPGSQRRTKRYRPIAEIYRATARFARFNLRNKKE